MIIKYPEIFHQDPVNFLNFESLNSDENYNIELHIDCRNFIRQENKKYYCIDFELPNGFLFEKTRNNYENNFEKNYDKIFTICPHTVKLRNSYLKNNKYEYTFYPSPDSWNRSSDKKYDIIYVGGGSEYLIPKSISEFNYIVVNKLRDRLTNVFNVSFDEKLNLISQSKICVVHNVIRTDFFVNDFRDLNNFINPNKTLGYPALTQHKSRVIEAARCRTLILCKKDGYNIIEDFFEKDVDFIYFDDDNFYDIVTDILNNYKKYAQIVENAFLKVSNNYSIQNFYKKIITNE